MLSVECDGSRIRIGDRFSVEFQRTLRIPSDGRIYPLPPGFGPYPLFPVRDFRDRLPETWNEAGAYFLSMYQREALWMAFSGADWKPNAVKVGAGGIDAISGLPFDGAIRNDPQNYIVCPKQLWLDGFNSGASAVTQFTAMPLGAGHTVEGQLTAKEQVGGIEIIVFEPRAGRFPDAPTTIDSGPVSQAFRGAIEMGLAGGGTVRQKIYPDPYGADSWDADNSGRAVIHILNSAEFQAVTGRKAPSTPVSAQTYIERGFPWFKIYDEEEGDLAAAKTLAGLKPAAEREDQADDS